MTDPELADATYVEPITPEIVAKIIAKERTERPDDKLVVLPTMGGQTALNTRTCAWRRDGTCWRRYDVDADRRRCRGYRQGGRSREVPLRRWTSIGLESRAFSGIATIRMDEAMAVTRYGRAARDCPPRPLHLAWHGRWCRIQQRAEFEQFARRWARCLAGQPEVLIDESPVGMERL